MLIKDLKGQEAFGERSTTGSGRNCEAPGGETRRGEYLHSCPYLERNRNVAERVNCRGTCMISHLLADSCTLWTTIKVELRFIVKKHN